MNKKLKGSVSLFALFFGLTLNGQSTIRPYPELFLAALDSTRSAIFKQPEAAESKLNYLFRFRQFLPDTARAALYNMNGIFHAVGGREDSALHYFLRSSSLFPSVSRKRAGSLTNSAIILKQRKQYTEANLLFKEAESICTTINDTICLATAIGEMASNYAQQGKHEEAVTLLLQSTRLLEAVNQTPQLMIDKQKLANTYLLSENYTFALKLFEEIIAYFDQTNQPYYEGLSRISHAETLNRIGHYEAGLKSAYRGIELIQPYNNFDLLCMLYMKTAEALHMLNKPQLARKQFEDALNLANKGSGQYHFVVLNAYLEFSLKTRQTNSKHLQLSDTEIQSLPGQIPARELIKFYNNLSELYETNANYLHALRYRKMASHLTDSLAKSEKKSTLNELHAKYQSDILRQEKELEEVQNAYLRAALSSTRKTLFLLTVLALFLLALFIATLRAFKLKKRVYRLEQQTQHQEKERLVREKEMASQNLKLHQELLAEKEDNLKLYALQIAELAEQVERIRAEKDAGISAPEGDRILVDAYLISLMKRFSAQEPQFLSRLEELHPNLTQREKTTCVLIRLRCKSKEIAKILNVSPLYMITLLYKLSKKLDANSIDDVHGIIQSYGETGEQ